MTLVRRLTPEDAPACDGIIAVLPYFFSDPSGVVNASRDLREHEGWVSEDDDRVSGFLCLDWPGSQTAEIAWMAVDPEYRRGGRGRQLVEQATGHARDAGARVLMLYTLPIDDSGETDDGFEGTRVFFRAMGFVDVCVVKPEGWSRAHLLMVRLL